MVEEQHIIKDSPFSQKGKAADDSENNERKEPAVPLINRVGFGQPPAEQSVAKANDTTKAADKPTEKRTVTSVDTKPVKDVMALFGQNQQLQQTLLATCFDKQADGKLKPKPDTELIADGHGGKVTVETRRQQIVDQMSANFEAAVRVSDIAMKNPDAVLAASLSVRKDLDLAMSKRDSLQKELATQGINPAVGNLLDSTLIDRYMQEHKELSPAQKDKLLALRDARQKETDLEIKYRDIKVMEVFPIQTRQYYAEFLRAAGRPQTAKAWDDEANKVAKDLQSPAGRSEFMKRQSELTRQASENDLDKSLQEKYLKNPNNPYALLESAAKKAKEGDIAGARTEMDKARLAAAKAFPDLDKDIARVQKDAEQLRKDGEALAEKAKAGKATPHELMMQQEKELKLVQEAQILDAFKLAKPKVDIAYADFLLNVDKNKESESNRKYARDILMGVRFDDLGKTAAAQEAEHFDELFEKAMNGSVDNRVGMAKFNKLMQEVDELKKRAATHKNDADIINDFKAAREKAEAAAKVAAGLNRDAANDNQQVIKQQLQKQIDSEMAKPVGARDEGKVKLLKAVMTPSHELNAEQKQLIAGVTECMKPEAQANKALVEKLAGSLKDKAALFDAVNSYSLIQQMEFQKQALNHARFAMLELDVAFDKGENNELVAEIEKDKYGAGYIAAMDSLQGHDGRTVWGDVKHATRDLAWYENAWKWGKGMLKEVAIALVSWGVGIAAGLGVAALTSWSGPGLVVAGGAAGFAAGATTGWAMRKYVFGDDVKFLSMNTVIDGVSGMTGGVAGTTYAAARIAGTAAVERVVAQQAARGVTLNTGQTWSLFKAAGIADKARIAVGGTPFLATFSSATAGSIAYRYPMEALTGNYNNLGDWALGSTMKVGMDIPANLIGARIFAGTAGAIESQVLANGGNYYSVVARQMLSNPMKNHLFWNSNVGREVMSRTIGMPAARPIRSELNAPLHNLLEEK